MIQNIEAKDIEIGDQLKVDAADGGVVWKRVTGWFLDGSGKVNIELNSQVIVKRIRGEKVMINRG
jgi:hypothetical protein